MYQPEKSQENSIVVDRYIENLKKQSQPLRAQEDYPTRTHLPIALAIIPVGYFACSVELNFFTSILLFVVMAFLSLHTLLNAFSMSRLSYAWCITSIISLLITVHGQPEQSFYVLITSLLSLIIATYYRGKYYLDHSPAQDIRPRTSIMDLFAYSAAIGFYFYFLKTKSFAHIVPLDTSLLFIVFLAFIYPIILVKFLRGITIWKLNVGWYLLVALAFELASSSFFVEPVIRLILPVSITGGLIAFIYTKSNFYTIATGILLLPVLIGIDTLFGGDFAVSSGIVSGLLLTLLFRAVIFWAYLGFSYLYIRIIQVDDCYLRPLSEGHRKTMTPKAELNEESSPFDQETVS